MREMEPVHNHLLRHLFDGAWSFDASPEERLVFLFMVKVAAQETPEEGICPVPPRAIWRQLFQEQDLEVCHEKGLAAHRRLEALGVIEEVSIEGLRWTFRIVDWESIRDSLDTHRARARASAAKRRTTK